jgi:pyruvate formate lyase activating enzyme
MDIKAPLAGYEKLAGVPVDPGTIRESIQVILEAGIEYQFRTTWVPDLLSQAAMDDIRNMMEALGANHVVQPFIAAHTLDPALRASRDLGVSQTENPDEDDTAWQE